MNKQNAVMGEVDVCICTVSSHSTAQGTRKCPIFYCSTSTVLDHCNHISPHLLLNNEKQQSNHFIFLNK
jgi:hypothetical protein